MKFLSPRVHGYLDYAVVLLLVLAPYLFGFGGAPRGICFALAIAQFAMSLLTAYPLGVGKMIPFTVHGGIELVTSIGLVVAPWIFAFGHQQPAARGFFIAMGVALFAVWLVTDYRAAVRERPGLREAPSGGARTGY